MELLQALVLGALQGIFEWLPVSSQGQIMGFAMALFKVGAADALKYAVMLHVGTLLAATIYFRSELFSLLTLKNKPLLKFLFIAVLATGLTAVPSYFFLKAVLSYSPFFLLLIIGFLLLLTGVSQNGKKANKKAALTNINAFFLGLAQGFSVLPGISRSGITTTALLFEGFSPGKAFKLSFILSIPSIFIAELAFGASQGFVVDFNAFLALIVAFVFGMLFIDILIRVAKRTNFSKFCIAFGLFYIFIALIESKIL